MKKRVFFIGMLAAGLIFTACSSDDSIIENASKNEACTFKLTLPSRMAMDTRAVEDKTTDGTAIDVDYNDLTCYLNYSGSRLRYNWAPTEAYGMTMIFDQLTAVPSTVTVVSNAITYINMLETVTIEGQNIEESADFLKNLPIASQNMNVNTAKAATDVDNQTLDDVTLFGTAPVVPGTPAIDNEFESNITLGALVARFELGNVTPGTGLESLTVDTVYVNNFYKMSNLDSADLFLYDSTNWSDDLYSGDFDWAKVLGDATVVDGTKCYAFQLFANDTEGSTSVPHFIFKVSGQLSEGYTLADGFTGDDSGNFADYFVTVDGLMVGGEVLTSVSRQNVYQIGDFSVMPSKITPDPEMPKLKLTVTCTAAPWGLITATPVIQ